MMIKFKHVPATNGCTDKLYIYFSGLDGRLKEDEYHLYAPAMKLGYESFFFKDISKRWYHTTNTEEIKQQLCNIVANFDGRVIFVGTSFGGYGAIMFGLHAHPAKIIAFSPQTSCQFCDTPLAKQYELSENRPIIEIHRCKTQRDNTQWNDKASADAMVEYATIIIHDCEIHSSVEALHNIGKLQEILQGA